MLAVVYAKAAMAKPAAVVPIAELERDAASVVRQVKESSAPAVITQAGHPEAVLLSIDAYRRGEAEREILTRLAQGERDISQGDGYDLEDVLNEADSLLRLPQE